LQEEALDVLYMSNVIVIKYIVIHNLSSLTSVRIFWSHLGLQLNHGDVVNGLTLVACIKVRNKYFVFFFVSC